MNFEKRILADGSATLYRGDSLELLRAGVFGKLGAIVSDPPYGIRLQESRGGSGSTDSPVSNGGRGLKRHHLYALLDLAQAAGVDGEVGSCHRSNSYNQKTSSDEVPAPGPPLPTFGRTQHVAPCWVIYCLRYRRTPTRQSSALWDWPWKVVTPVQPSTPVSNTSSAGVSCPSTENCAT